MKSSRLTVEGALFGLAVALAIGLRLINLGSEPLSDLEANWALQAWGIAQGNSVTLGPQPGYVLPTALLFFLLGSSTTLARLLPAVVGGLAIGLPYLLRPQLGRKTALVLAFGLALDPGLIALSRQTGGAMIAVACGLAAYTAWSVRKPIAAGVFAGFALLAGPFALAGLVTGLLTWGFIRVLNLQQDREQPRIDREAGQGSEIKTETRAQAVRAALLAGGGTVLLAGTLLMRAPQGIGALADSLPAYLFGWLIPPGVPILRIWAALLVYHPLPTLFGLASAGWAWWQGDGLGRRMSVWFLVAMLLASIYPARVVSDLAWALIPLWILAAKLLAQELQWESGESLTSLGQAVISVIFLSYVWLNVASLARAPGDPQTRLLKWALVGGVLALILGSTVLIGLGWSPKVARRGLVWGLSLSLGIFTLGVAWRTIDSADGRVHEWWYPQPSTSQEDLLLQTLGDISEWNTGRRDGLEALVLRDTPSLRWSLREHPEIMFTPPLTAADFPSIVIADLSGQPRLADVYRGMDFVWQISPIWEGIFPPDGLRWLAFRQAPTQSDQVILWARNDLFVDSSP